MVLLSFQCVAVLRLWNLGQGLIVLATGLGWIDKPLNTFTDVKGVLDIMTDQTLVKNMTPG